MVMGPVIHRVWGVKTRARDGDGGCTSRLALGLDPVAQGEGGGEIGWGGPEHAWVLMVVVGAGCGWQLPLASPKSCVSGSVITGDN